GLEFKDGLQRPLAYFRLVGRVGRDELTTRDKRLHRGGDVVLVRTGTKEEPPRRHVAILRRALLEIVHNLPFIHRRDVHRLLQQELGGHIGEELIDAACADARQHFADIFRRVGRVSHLWNYSSSIFFRYASWVIRFALSASRLDGRILTIHPSP